jgi:aspartyl-tRNA(Asn)/glutamyl-tRNA(Gln) amidotransferase subunit C
MKITDEMVDYVAELSRLKVLPEEREELRESLGDIIGYMDVLNEVDTDGVEPMSHVFSLKNVFREDEVQKSFPMEELLKNAPKRSADSFVVPKTVE